MQKFTKLNAIAAPLPMANVDTDMIIAKQFLKTIKRTGLGQYLFDDMRRKTDGTENPDFVLNREPFRKAEILVALDNFGCGSSREHAPWALLDFGIRCVIAPSYADIFYNNCFKNGILPLVLEKSAVEKIIADITESPTVGVEVDLENQTVRRGNGETFKFEIDPFRKRCLLEGLDDIGLTLKNEAKISGFEQKQSGTCPWLYQERQ